LDVFVTFSVGLLEFADFEKGKGLLSHRC